MFYYTFSVINTIFVPCTALLYDSTVATQTLKLSTTPLSLSCGIHLISLLMKSSLVLSVDCFHKLCFSGTPPPPQKIVRWVEILGIGWPGVFGLTRNESVPWEVMPEVFKCPVREKSVSWGIYGTKYSRLSKFCGRQPLKNFRGYGLLISLESF